MATVRRHSTYPNLLLVTGSDVVSGDYRQNIKDAIYRQTSATSPVFRGSHDFWITYKVGDGNGGEGGESYADGAASPHALRAAVSMGDPGADVAGQIDTMLQEVGHRWLVPANMMVTFNGAPQPLVGSATMQDEVNRNMPYGSPLLLGRSDVHWSSYFNADASPMDGVAFSRGHIDDGMTRWDVQSLPRLSLSVTGLPSLNHLQTYCDLDLMLMGSKTPQAAYSASGGRFYWIEPQVVAPLEYHIGIFVAFSADDFAFFGFYGDPRTLAFERSTGGGRVTANVGLGYHPFSEPLGAMMLRVVRRGSRYFFQARNGNSLAGGLQAIGMLFGGPPPSGPAMSDDLAAVAPPDGGTTFDRFRTVAVLDEASARPLAVGVITKTWNSVAAEGAFFTFELRDGNTDVVLPSMKFAQPMQAGSSYGTLPAGQLFKEPVTGSWIAFRNSIRMDIGTPWTDLYNCWNGVNRAPKIVTRAPSGDFFFGSSLKVRRTLFSPWAAGAAVNKSVWGVERSAPATGVTIPSETRAQWVTPPATFRTAFVIAAPDSSQITAAMAQNADNTRRYWEAAFREGTQDAFWADTRL